VSTGSEVERIAAVLLAGGTVLLPTDTVYGVAALPSVPGATDRLFALKEREAHQPLAVLVADAAQARALTGPTSTEVSRWIDELWPGPLTLVLPRAASARDLALGGDPGTIGVRCPDHALVRAVAAAVGPVATTSANRHGEPTPTTAAEAAAGLAGPVGLVVDDGPSGTVASTVVDASVDPWRVLRHGALPAEALEGGPAAAGSGAHG
jgi:tRNA threonylcarbamoyl adenosine modification protein (Sua5/YciO/YrdC/YwlC family)